MNIKIFSDGANRDEILSLCRNPLIKGFTTNPTLMRKAGVTDYEGFARSILFEIQNRPISLEVFADEFLEMERQACKISSWGDNVYVKIPVTNTKAESTLPMIRRLLRARIKINVTAITTFDQVSQVAEALADDTPTFVSVFAGRIADTGIDPVPLMAQAVSLLERQAPNAELIWASPREVLNIVQAERIGCHVITATSEILKKLDLLGRDLTEYSLDTVKMFHRDAAQAGFQM